MARLTWYARVQGLCCVWVMILCFSVPIDASLGLPEPIDSELLIHWNDSIGLSAAQMLAVQRLHEQYRRRTKVDEARLIPLGNEEDDHDSLRLWRQTVVRDRFESLQRADEELFGEMRDMLHESQWPRLKRAERQRRRALSHAYLVAAQVRLPILDPDGIAAIIEPPTWSEVHGSRFMEQLDAHDEKFTSFYVEMTDRLLDVSNRIQTIHQDLEAEAELLQATIHNEAMLEAELEALVESLDRRMRQKVEPIVNSYRAHLSDAWDTIRHLGEQNDPVTAVKWRGQYFSQAFRPARTVVGPLHCLRLATRASDLPEVRADPVLAQAIDTFRERTAVELMSLLDHAAQVLNRHMMAAYFLPQATDGQLDDFDRALQSLSRRARSIHESCKDELNGLLHEVIGAQRWSEITDATSDPPATLRRDESERRAFTDYLLPHPMAVDQVQMALGRMHEEWSQSRSVQEAVQQYDQFIRANVMPLRAELEDLLARTFQHRAAGEAAKPSITTRIDVLARRYHDRLQQADDAFFSNISAFDDHRSVGVATHLRAWRERMRSVVVGLGGPQSRDIDVIHVVFAGSPELLLIEDIQALLATHDQHAGDIYRTRYSVHRTSFSLAIHHSSDQLDEVAHALREQYLEKSRLNRRVSVMNQQFIDVLIEEAHRLEKWTAAANVRLVAYPEVFDDPRRLHAVFRRELSQEHASTDMREQLLAAQSEYLDAYDDLSRRMVESLRADAQEGASGANSIAFKSLRQERDQLNARVMMLIRTLQGR